MIYTKKRTALSVIGLCFMTLLSCADKSGKTYYSFNENNELLRPKDYRTWVFAGTGTTPKSTDSAAFFPDFQNIYIDPESYAFWKKNAYYREGTIFVKELIRKGDTISPIGKGFFQGDAYSLSATIKDSVRFPEAPGGWEYFKYTNYDKGTLTESSLQLGGACISCHSNTKAGYGPFTEFYMPMREAKGFGDNSPENLNTRKGLRLKCRFICRKKNDYAA